MDTSYMKKKDGDAMTCVLQPAPADAAAISAAGIFEKIAPIWPLDDFVAVNPFWGYIDLPFETTLQQMQSAMGHRLYMPETYYAHRLRSGAITPDDVRIAMERRVQAGAVVSFDTLQASLDAMVQKAETLTSDEWDAASLTQQGHPYPTTLLDRLPENLQQAVLDHVALWCSAYFDQGQAAWNMMDHSKRFFSAWRQLAELDRMMDLAGLNGCRSIIKSLPPTPHETLPYVLEQIGIPGNMITDYFQRLLYDHLGWASHLRLYSWRQIPAVQDNPLLDLLAVRISFEMAAFNFLRRQGSTPHWTGRPDTHASARHLIPALCLEAHEISYERKLSALLRDRLAQAASDVPEARRPAAQCVFCIDVRSERIRRALESAAPDIDTIGFAGFFGFPIHYSRLGDEHSTAQYPVLLSSSYQVGETLGHDDHGRHDPEDSARHAANRRSKRQFSAGWSQLTAYGVSSLNFVEMLGLGYGWKLVRDGLIQPSDDAPPIAHPDIHRSGLAEGHAATQNHFSLDDQINLARGALTNMGLTAHQARLVLLCGHGAATTNNPYQASLDCGACGGHAGGPNARVAAAVLNRSEVRTKLAADGIHIPSDTWFLAGEHNTTTDEVTIYDLDQVPASHLKEVAQLQHHLADAGERVRKEKAALEAEMSPQSADNLSEAARQRAADWSQVRPEWGLAGNAAFIAAPRRLTRGINLEGRAFLHDYDWRQDKDLSVLTLIMTAPMVVAHWINMQYYASTVCPGKLGAGTKTLHNVVGMHGVCLGNAGDLQIGLPIESLHDGIQWRHDPLRLLVLIAAPRSAISQVIEKHATVRTLLDNQWIHLRSIDPTAGNAIFRYQSGGGWIGTEIRA